MIVGMMEGMVGVVCDDLERGVEVGLDICSLRRLVGWLWEEKSEVGVDGDGDGDAAAAGDIDVGSVQEDEDLCFGMHKSGKEQRGLCKYWEHSSEWVRWIEELKERRIMAIESGWRRGAWYVGWMGVDGGGWG